MVGSSVKIKFSRKNEGVEHYVLLIRDAPEYCTFQFDDVRDLRLYCTDITSSLRGFNESLTRNDRDGFYTLLGLNKENAPLLDIARIIGILTPFCHFFSVFSNVKIVENLIKDSFDRVVKGCVALDWSEIAKDCEDSNQVVFVTDDELLSKFDTSLDTLYKNGIIGKIVLSGESNSYQKAFWIESKDVDKAMDKCCEVRTAVIKRINENLRVRFS